MFGPFWEVHLGGRKRGMRGGRRRKAAAFGFEVPPGPGPGMPGFGGFPWAMFGRRGPRVRRGDVRQSILALLAEEPRNGYQIMQELETRSHGMWRPSPGSIYPALQQLQDEGLVREEASGTGRMFHLTDKGKKHVEKHADDETPPWEAINTEAGSDTIALGNLIRQVVTAAMQVAHVGTSAQKIAARQLLLETKRALYGVLSEEEDDADDEASDDE